jgi:hypothetical protein
MLETPEAMMMETPQQYTDRILGYVTSVEPRDVYASTPQRLRRMIDGVPAEALRTRPAPDKWSIGEIVAHLGDAEIVGAFRMRLILGSPGIDLVAYDQDTWAASGHYETREPAKSIGLFHAVRDANLALLDSLEPEQWKHYGMHSERGQESIEHIVRMFAGHDLNHLQQIERILVAK